MATLSRRRRWRTTSSENAADAHAQILSGRHLARLAWLRLAGARDPPAVRDPLGVKGPKQKATLVQRRPDRFAADRQGWRCPISAVSTRRWPRSPGRWSVSPALGLGACQLSARVGGRPASGETAQGPSAPRDLRRRSLTCSDGLAPTRSLWHRRPADHRRPAPSQVAGS
jgi:hypothetical protein